MNMINAGNTEMLSQMEKTNPITLDSLYIEIETIKDTLAAVSEHTLPVDFLGLDALVILSKQYMMNYT